MIQILWNLTSKIPSLKHVSRFNVVTVVVVAVVVVVVDVAVVVSFLFEVWNFNIIQV